MNDQSKYERFFEKIQKIEFNLERMNEWFSIEKMNAEKEKQNYKLIYAVYYAMQTISEGVTDLSAMVVKKLISYVRDDYSNFETLMQKEIINKQLFNKLKKINGLQNRIAHDYNGIVDEVAWDAIKELLPFINMFIERVREWIQKQK